MGSSLVSKYGTPKMRTADALEDTVAAAVEYLANYSDKQFELGLRREELDYKRRSDMIVGLTNQWGPMIKIDPDMYYDDDKLRVAIDQGAKLGELKLASESFVGSTISPYALDAVTYGGFEIVNDKGKVVSELDPDITPLATTDYDILATDQWINGSSFITGIANREDITSEEMFELERLGLLEGINAEDWNPVVHGAELKNNWRTYKAFFKNSENYVDNAEYATLIKSNWDAYNQRAAALTTTNPEYARAYGAYNDWEKDKINLFTITEDDEMKFFIGNEKIKPKDIGKYPAFSDAFSMSPEELTMAWGTIGPRLQQEAQNMYGMGVYNKFQKIVYDYDRMLNMEQTYLKNTPIDMIREGETAGLVADAMYGFQSSVEPVMQTALEMLHSGAITSQQDLIAFVAKNSGQIISSYQYQAPEVFGEELVDEMLTSYVDGILERYRREGGGF